MGSAPSSATVAHFAHSDGCTQFGQASRVFRLDSAKGEVVACLLPRQDEEQEKVTSFSVGTHWEWVMAIGQVHFAHSLSLIWRSSVSTDLSHHDNVIMVRWQNEDTQGWRRDDYDLVDGVGKKTYCRYGTANDKNSICVLGKQQYFCCGKFFSARCEVVDDTVCFSLLQLSCEWRCRIGTLPQWRLWEA